ncbi:IS1595 family transposase [Nitrospirillum sp. BR 11163]|uniref:IS1595 family transposase n=1 Tax=Nitrospirillum sp. BR 11163 TaxID=3104323 RepID=UPI002AFE57B8|nr:IS1595 family transposase [Nitrospirillum sp. BR 11163]MEA1674370.1 IS1595 family transposase [Nitrospirillum sp. BR 11163]
MTQHFLLSSKARSLSLINILRASDYEIFEQFKAVRFADNNGEPFCPHCGSIVCFECPRKNGSKRWRCKGCYKDFTLTSGTLFASHKLHLQVYLAAIAIFINEVKGKAALALSRDLNVQYKTAFVIAHKIREAMSTEVSKIELGGQETEVEVDGAYFGGYIRPRNLKSERIDRRKIYKPGKRVVVVIRQRGGLARTAVFKSEQESISFIREHVAPGTTIHADEAPGWNALHASYNVMRINHSEAYSLNGACTNQAESFFSRLRRGEVGHHHRVIGPYLDRYAGEMAWRENNRRMPNGDQLNVLLKLIMNNRKSEIFNRYWHH